MGPIAALSAAAAAAAGSGASTAARLSQALPNARDLHEAFPAIPPGRLIRCANPAAAGPDDVHFLVQQLGVRDLIDLRSGEEMEEDDPGSALMGAAAVREWRRGWLWPGQLFPLPERPPKATAAPTTTATAPPDTAPATAAAATSNSTATHHPSTTTAANGSASTDPPPSPSAAPASASASQPHPPSPSSSASPAPPPPPAPLVRHHISLLERRRFYLALAARIPAATTAAALLTNLVDPPAARRRLLPYVNGGGLPLLYEMLLDSARPELRRVLEVLLEAAAARRPVLFFCRAGKDRTGLVAAAVLAVAGASEEQIVQDYARSDAYHRVALAGLERREELAGLDRAAFERAPPGAMRATLAHVRTRYGSLPGYLTSIGFGPSSQRRLRELLTAEW